MNSKQDKIEQAKRMLADPELAQRDIIDIAFEVGFNDISTFNYVFRRSTQMTPSEFRAFHVNFKRVTSMSPAEYLETHG